MDEYEIIELIARTAGRLPPRYSPIGDDVVSLETRPGKLVLKSDMLVASTDVPPGMTYRQAGRKAVAMCVSDFAAKGVRPEALMVSLGLPRSLNRRDILSIASGFKDAMREWRVHLLGGDTNEADDLIIDSILSGFAASVIPRDGARPGDLVVVSGRFGTTSAGLKILLEGAKAGGPFRKLALRNVYYPAPRLEVGIALRNYLSSAMDSSDGLAICLHSIAEASRVGISVDKLPYEPALEGFATENRYQIEDLILYGGEEYEIVATLPKAKLAKANSSARLHGSRLAVIGHVTEERGVTMSQGKPIQKKGWVHLS